ncbi:MAG: GtrA family protein [Eubacteriales bacterium]|nr:GtrA family protein [Eubacteriales bacterium]
MEDHIQPQLPAPGDSSRRSHWLRLVFNREVITYLIVGGLTTLVNLAVFSLLSRVVGYRFWWVSNAVAIPASILFAYVANRLLVFRSNAPVLQEMVRFFASRVVVSLVFEYGAMALLYDVIGLTGTIHIWRWELLISKLLSQIFVIVGNYLISKFFVFVQLHRKEPDMGGSQ